MLLIGRDAVSDSKHGGWKNIRLGMSSDVLRDYAVCTGFDASGAPEYGKVRKTAGEAAAEYASWEDFCCIEREGPDVQPAD